jgi:choline dehydrogenase-like flavoprotein
MEDQGLPLIPDMFTTGESAHGCGHAPRTHHEGIRSTGADFVTGENHRDNIAIVCNTLVDKVNFSLHNGSLQATSVQLIDNFGTHRTVRANKEIIICGGAYCSPAILLRSGIGPKSELAKLDIDCVVDSQGVGKNLLDHLIVFTFYEAEKEGLTNDHLVYHGDAAMHSYKLYKGKKTGVLSTFPFGAFAFARLDERLNDEPLWQQAKKDRQDGRDPMGLTPSQPHIEFFTTELYGGPKQYDQFPIDKKHAFSMITELFSPKSKGSVTLRSADPFDNPIVDCNYLADPLDLLVLSEGVRFGNEIVMQGAATKDVVKGSWPSNLTHHAFTKREEWIPHVKNEATTCYHAAGTCKMGKDGDALAVLDAKLQVRGVKGLRVADCSVMPTLHSGHTQMPAYGIGEKAADLIREAAGTL